MAALESQPSKEIQTRLTNFCPDLMENPLFRKSAVLLLLIPTKTNHKLVLTTRSPHLKSHKGQMSFPGGKFDDSTDLDLQHTALREAHEEIGVDPSDVKIIGRLNDLPMTTGYMISPFVGVFKGEIPVSYSLNSKEVTDLVEIPLKFFLEQPVFRDKVDFEFNYRGYSTMSLYVDYFDSETTKRYHIWGATAHIIAEFFKICYNHLLAKPDYSRPPLDLIIQYINEKRLGPKK